MNDIDQDVISHLREMARQGNGIAEMYRFLRQCLGMDVHILTTISYFRSAFCLSLAEAKPIAAFTRSETGREITDEEALNNLLVPKIKKHRPEWDV